MFLPIIPYSKQELSDLYPPHQTKRLENHTLHSRTYTYSLYIGEKILHRGTPSKGE